MSEEGGCRAGLPRPATGSGIPAPQNRKHLRRLERIFDTGRASVFLVTVCVRDRSSVLATPDIAPVLIAGWRDAFEVHGWMVGRYVVMPDHVHFFATPASSQGKGLSDFVGGWKRWTRRQTRQAGLQSFAWQREFFDHLLRSGESYDQKWEYVRGNPVRAGLCRRHEEWPYQGELHRLPW